VKWWIWLSDLLWCTAEEWVYPKLDVSKTCWVCIEKLRINESYTKEQTLLSSKLKNYWYRLNTKNLEAIVLKPIWFTIQLASRPWPSSKHVFGHTLLITLVHFFINFHPMVSKCLVIGKKFKANILLNRILIIKTSLLYDHCYDGERLST
jgi:hypothetical protein